MADTKQRTESARDHDDSELIEDAERTPTEGGSSGGDIARDVGARDEARSTAEDTGVTRVQKRDKIQPNPNRKSDNEGAQTDR